MRVAEDFIFLLLPTLTFLPKLTLGHGWRGAQAVTVPYVGITITFLINYLKQI
jgi:hypothetical protein